MKCQHLLKRYILPIELIEDLKSEDRFKSIEICNIKQKIQALTRLYRFRLLTTHPRPMSTLITLLLSIPNTTKPLNWKTCRQLFLSNETIGVVSLPQLDIRASIPKARLSASSGQTYNRLPKQNKRRSFSLFRRKK